MGDSEHPSEFEAVKTRLAEIAEAVEDESLSLDDALDLYEEAVSLGLQASDLLESDIVVPEEGEGQPLGEQSGQVSEQGGADSSPSAESAAGGEPAPDSSASERA